MLKKKKSAGRLSMSDSRSKIKRKLEGQVSPKLLSAMNMFKDKFYKFTQQVLLEREKWGEVQAQIMMGSSHDDSY